MLRIVAAGLIVLLGACPSVAAEGKRVALIVGMGQY
jgi:hypothetical protein